MSDGAAGLSVLSSGFLCPQVRGLPVCPPGCCSTPHRARGPPRRAARPESRQCRGRDPGLASGAGPLGAGGLGVPRWDRGRPGCLAGREAQTCSHTRAHRHGARRAGNVDAAAPSWPVKPRRLDTPAARRPHSVLPGAGHWAARSPVSAFGAAGRRGQGHRDERGDIRQSNVVRRSLGTT